MNNDDAWQNVVDKLIDALAMAHEKIGRLETDRGNLHARIEKLMRDNQTLMARQPSIREVS